MGRFAAVCLVLMLVMMTEIGGMVGEARTCKSKSHYFGYCVGHETCAAVCQVGVVASFNYPLVAAATSWSVLLDGSLFFFFLVILASFWAGISFVTFLSGVVHHVMLGYTVIIAIITYFLLFSGFFINPDRMSPSLIWIHHLAVAKYPYEAALQNEFNNPEECFVRGIQIFDGMGKAFPKALKVKLLDSLKVIGINSTSCVTTGADVLQQLGITRISKWNGLWVTVAWGVLFRILFYISLVMGNKSKRK